ncbi:MAG TPA: glycosyltransferase [Candidatus Elarobacter sp.]|jgi:GT2 family glycosyltransferase
MYGCSVVIATCNRWRSLTRTLDKLTALPERPDVIVVDNASNDGTLANVRATHPSVRALSMRSNVGAAARNVGAVVAATRYVAFCDDDCWWEPGALARASELLDRHHDVALLNARVIVDGDRLDEPCALMAASRIPKRGACPGRAIAQFMAGAAIVRRDAFLEIGGFHRRYHLGAEESLAALDLLERGWQLIYDPQLVLHHVPYRAGRRPYDRRVVVTRNRLWTAWLRHSSGAAWRATVALARRVPYDPVARDALARAIVGLPWIVRERRQVRPDVERLLALLAELPA